LYHIANGLTTKYAWVSNISGHSSGNDTYFVFTDGSPKAAVHSLVITKGKYTRLLDLPEADWLGLGTVLAAEVTRLTRAGAALEKIGYRVIINNGPGTVTVAQPHAHLVAGNPGLWPVLPL